MLVSSFGGDEKIIASNHLSFVSHIGTSIHTYLWVSKVRKFVFTKTAISFQPLDSVWTEEELTNLFKSTVKFRDFAEVLTEFDASHNFLPWLDEVQLFPFNY